MRRPRKKTLFCKSFSPCCTVNMYTKYVFNPAIQIVFLINFKILRRPVDSLCGFNCQMFDRNVKLCSKSEGKLLSTSLGLPSNFFKTNSFLFIHLTLGRLMVTFAVLFESQLSSIEPYNTCNLTTFILFSLLSYLSLKC